MYIYIYIHLYISNSIKKWAKDLNINFSKGDRWSKKTHEKMLNTTNY